MNSPLTKETSMDTSTHPLTNGIDALEKGVDQEGEPMEQEIDETKLTTDDCKMKKRVSWAEEADLVVVHYFEMDESERGEIVFVICEATLSLFLSLSLSFCNI